MAFDFSKLPDAKKIEFAEKVYAITDNPEMLFKFVKSGQHIVVLSSSWARMVANEAISAGNELLGGLTK